MSRSLKKGPFVDPKLLKKVAADKAGSGVAIKTWSRSSEIAPEMVGHVFAVHNGRTFIEVRVSEEMVGHRLGEFSPTRKFVKHGGKIQKDIEIKSAEAGKAATAAATGPAKK
jgi:small subunit ribosomal protein S19